MMRSVVVAVALITSGGSALAQTHPSMVNCAAKAIQYADALLSKDDEGSMPEQCGTIEVELGHTRLLKLDRQFKSIVIGNTDVADVVMQDPRTLLITAKVVGEAQAKQHHQTRTNLLLLDNANEPLYSVEIAVISAPAQKGDLVQSLGRVQVFGSNGDKKKLTDYIPYACSSGNCIKLKAENQGELTKEISDPAGGGAQYEAKNAMSASATTGAK